MKKYKVEFIQTEKFVLDVLAESEQEATDIATPKFYELENQGTIHYYNTGNGGLEVGNIYDVTNTDDPFDPEN